MQRHLLPLLDCPFCGRLVLALDPTPFAAGRGLASKVKTVQTCAASATRSLRSLSQVNGLLRAIRPGELAAEEVNYYRETRRMLTYVTDASVQWRRLSAEAFRDAEWAFECNRSPSFVLGLRGMN